MDLPILKYYKLTPGAIAPGFATKNSACFDLTCHWERGQHIKGYDGHNLLKETKAMSDTFHVFTRERYLIPTGLVFKIPEGYSVRLHPRSGLALKLGLILGNNEGVIDSDYYHEVYIMIANASFACISIENNTRLCQGELVREIQYDLEETFEAPGQTTDRIGGLGSTGVGHGDRHKRT